MNVVEVYINFIIKIYDSIINNYERSLNAISEIEKELQDINHEIEFSNSKDMYSGYLLYKEIKNLRTKRREAKERTELLKNIYDFLTTQQGKDFRNKLNQIKGDSRKTFEKQQNRMYAAKLRDDLTVQDKHIEKGNSFENMLQEFQKDIIAIFDNKSRK